MTAAGGGPPEDLGLDCILGRCDSLRAEVFFRARLPPGAPPSVATLAGALTGPDCRYAITLPVTAKLVAVTGTDAMASGSTSTIVARAILTEPSFWTPELPSLYRLDVRLVVAGREVAGWRRLTGLRRAGVRGRSLWLDGRRYVPRGLVRPAGLVDPAAFRDAALAAVVADPAEAFLDHCDAAGVAVLGLLADAAGRPFDPEAAAAAIVRWAWHPCVLMAVVPQDVSAQVATRIATSTIGRRGTLVVAWEADGSCPPPALPSAVDLLVVTLPGGGRPHETWRTDPPAVPLVARRPEKERAEVAAASAPPSRRACDALQADLAGWGTGGAGPPSEWAGFVSG